MPACCQTIKFYFKLLLKVRVTDESLCNYEHKKTCVGKLYACLTMHVYNLISAIGERVSRISTYTHVGPSEKIRLPEKACVHIQVARHQDRTDRSCCNQRPTSSKKDKERDQPSNSSSAATKNKSRSSQDASTCADQAQSRARTDDRDMSRARMEDLQLEQARSDLEALSISERCGQAESALAAARVALERLRREREEDLDRWQEISERHKNVLESMQKERHAAELGAEQALKEAEGAKKACSEALDLYNETKEELVEAVKEVNVLRADGTRSQVQMDQLRSLLSDKDAALESMKDAVARAQEQVHNLRGLLSDKDAVIVNLRDACSALGGSADRVMELEALLKQEESARKMCEAALAEAESVKEKQIGTLQSELDRFTAEQVRACGLHKGQ
jgi:hypothetical protein